MINSNLNRVALRYKGIYLDVENAQKMPQNAQEMSQNAPQNVHDMQSAQTGQTPTALGTKEAPDMQRASRPSTHVLAFTKQLMEWGYCLSEELLRALSGVSERN